MFNLDSALGIEVSEQRMILVSVQKGFQDFRLKNRLVIDHYRDLPRAELMGRIQQFVRQNGFNRENVILGLPRNQVVVREVELPLEVEENLDQVVRSQVDKFEPGEEASSYYDYAVASRDEENRRILLQVVMVPKVLIDDLLELFEELDLYPAAIRFSSVAFQNVLVAHREELPRSTATLIIRAEEESVEVAAVTKGQQLFSLGRQGTLSEEVLDQLLEDFSEVFSHYSSFVQQFEAVYVTGERAEECLEILRRRVPECSLLSNGLQLGRDDVTHSEKDRLSGALGLAISGLSRVKNRVNLIPEERRKVGGRSNLVFTYVLGLLFLITLGAVATHGYFQQRALAQQIDTQIQRLRPEVEGAMSIQDQIEVRRQQLEELKSMMGDRQETLLVLRDLTERIPDDTYLQNLQLQGDQLTMQGYSSQASYLLPVLLESPYLESVKTNWITQDPRQPGKERFNFAATLK